MKLIVSVLQYMELPQENRSKAGQIKRNACFIASLLCCT